MWKQSLPPCPRTRCVSHLADKESGGHPWALKVVAVSTSRRVPWGRGGPSWRGGCYVCRRMGLMVGAPRHSTFCRPPSGGGWRICGTVVKHGGLARGAPDRCGCPHPLPTRVAPQGFQDVGRLRDNWLFTAGRLGRGPMVRRRLGKGADEAAWLLASRLSVWRGGEDQALCGVLFVCVMSRDVH